MIARMTRWLGGRQNGAALRRFAVALTLFGVLHMAVLGAAKADTGPWSSAVLVSEGTPGGWWPDVAADDAGNVHVVWNSYFLDGLDSGDPNVPEYRAAGRTTNGFSERPANDVAALFYSRWDGTTWTEPNDIALIWWGHALRASLAADDRGNLHLAYKGFGTIDQSALEGTAALGPEDLWYTNSPGDTAGSVASWSPTRRISRAKQAYFSDIAIDSRGGLHLIWTESFEHAWGLYYSRSVDGGKSWSSRVPLEGENFVWWYRAQLEIDPWDGLHVVWEVTDESSLGSTRGVVYAESVDGGETWTRETFPADLPGYPMYGELEPGLQQPSIGVDGNGNVLLVARDAASNAVKFMRRDSVQGWSEPAAIRGIEAGVARPHDSYDMVTDSAGNVHLALTGYLPGASDMRLLHIEWTGRAWERISVISASPPYPEFPRLALSNGNRLHVVWFVGDRPSIDREPVGVWYSTALTAAPEVAPVATTESNPPPASTGASESTIAKPDVKASASPSHGLRPVPMAAAGDVDNRIAWPGSPPLTGLGGAALFIGAVLLARARRPVPRRRQL